MIGLVVGIIVGIIVIEVIVGYLLKRHRHKRREQAARDTEAIPILSTSEIEIPSIRCP